MELNYNRRRCAVFNFEVHKTSYWKHLIPENHALKEELKRQKELLIQHWLFRENVEDDIIIPPRLIKEKVKRNSFTNPFYLGSGLTLQYKVVLGRHHFYHINSEVKIVNKNGLKVENVKFS